MTALGYTRTTDVVVGYRSWRILAFRRLDGSETFRLCAIGTLGIPKVWEPKQATKAVCSAYETCHEAPWPDHECGVWALRRPEDARRRMVSFMIWQAENAQKAGGERLAGWACGAVSMWGRLIEHEHGWRAQYAYPYALTVESTDPAVAAALRGEYHVDAEWAGADLTEKIACKVAAKAAAQQAAPPPADDGKPDVDRWVRAYRLSEDRAKIVQALTEQANTSKLPVLSRDVCRHLFHSHGLAAEADDASKTRRIAAELSDAELAGEVVRVRAPGAARWWPAGSSLPDGYQPVADRWAQDDEKALRALQDTLAASGSDTATTREVLAYLGREDASRSYFTRFAHCLSRQVIRGNVRRVNPGTTQKSVWALA